MRRIVWLALLVSALSGCQTQAQQEQYLWVRTDGRSGAKDPALQAQYEIDRTVCFGEVQKSAAGAPVIYYSGLEGAITAAMMQSQYTKVYIDIMKGCMAGRGYLMVPASQAAAVAESLRKNTPPKS